MLYMSSANRIVRIHAPFVSENEIEKINNYLRSQAEPDYVDEILNFVDEKEVEQNLIDGENQDELYSSCLLYTSPSPRDRTRSRMPSSA